MGYADVRDLAMGANADGVGNQAGTATLVRFWHGIAPPPSPPPPPFSFRRVCASNQIASSVTAHG